MTGFKPGLHIVIRAHATAFNHQDPELVRPADLEWANLCAAVAEAGPSIRMMEIDGPLFLQSGCQGLALGLAAMLKSTAAGEDSTQGSGLRTLRVRQNSCEAECIISALAESGAAIE